VPPGTLGSSNNNAVKTSAPSRSYRFGRESGSNGAEVSRLPLSASLLNLSVSVIEVGKILPKGNPAPIFV